ncbi:MAG: CDP-alcohol phosphatidyltransferase family protein [Muribaculaceae bacterium]|nr:CDP-alcohol phosphatidyltransferase family protein [Muribaculaceae bacterium]
MTLKEEYQSSLKSSDTEEWFDLHFHRPLGFLWAKLFEKIGVSPNAITVASIFMGVIGGAMLYFGQRELAWINWLGMLLITWADTFDSADGQLARMTQQYSRMGRILDGVSGDLWFAAICFAIVFRELDFGDRLTGSLYFANHEWQIWALGIAAGASHALQAAMADYYRQFHLFFLKGQQGSELDSTAKLNEQYHQLEWGRNFWSKMPLFFYRGYTSNQEHMTPKMQRLRAALKERYGEDGVPTQEFREYFRQLSLPLMKYTNILTFNTRTIACFIAVLINIPWLYFAFEIVVLNILLIYMVLRHEGICKKALKKLQESN